MQNQYSKIENFVQVQINSNLKMMTTMKTLGLNKACRAGNIKKEQGVNALSVCIILLLLPLLEKSIHALLKGHEHNLMAQYKKDVFYRFTQGLKFNWRQFLCSLALSAVGLLQRYTNWQRCSLIFDDTIMQKYGKKVEKTSWHWDHKENRHIAGFQELTMGWYDGSSFIPIDFGISMSARVVHDETKEVDARTAAGKRRAETKKSKLQMMLEMLERANQYNLSVGFVLFDSWFAYPSIISKIATEIGYDVLCRMKETEKICVKCRGKNVSTKRLAAQLSQKSHWIPELELFANSKIVELNDMPGRMVVCNPKKGKRAILVCTDLSLSEKEIIERYAHRWAIECFYNTGKNMLQLGKEQSRLFEAVICQHTLAYVRHILLTIMARLESDPRTLGELFSNMKYRLEYLNFICFLERFLSELMNTVFQNEKAFIFVAQQIGNILEQLRFSVKRALFMGCET